MLNKYTNVTFDVYPCIDTGLNEFLYLKMKHDSGIQVEISTLKESGVMSVRMTYHYWGTSMGWASRCKFSRT